MTTERTISESAETADQAASLPSPRHLVGRVRWFVGRHLSVRWKLTLWYAAIYALTLVVIALLLPRTLQAQTNRVIDRQLHDTAVRVSALLNQPAVGPTGPVEECAGARPALLRYCYVVKQELEANSTQLSAPGQFEAVYLHDTSDTRHFLPYSIRAGLASRNITFDPLYLGEVMATGSPVYYDVKERDADVRAYLLPLTPPPGLAETGVRGVLAVFQAKTSYAQIQQALYIILLFAVPAGFLVALTVGWFIARAALRPIGRISRTVRAIGSSTDLSRRLNFVGPQDEIGRLAETFDDMMRRLELMFESQKQFIADASHELRTPLTAIRGNADLMTIAPPEERAACIAAIRRESERMSRLVTDLLMLAEADIAEQPIQYREVCLNDVLQEVCRSSTVVAGDAVAVSLEIPHEILLEADPDRLKQLFLNLVDNAIKFTPRGGRVTVRASQRGREAVVEVEDTGIGIPPDEQEAIFRRFYRTERSRSTRGSGLGLSICASIVEAHGGTIAVRSRPGHGTVFTITLPLRRSTGKTGSPGYPASARV